MDMKEEWRYASRDSGEQYAMIHGTTLIQRLHAGNSDMEQLVKIHTLVPCITEFLLTL